MPPTLPLEINISSITLAGFDPNIVPPNPGPSGGDKPIPAFPGSPLYCHVKQNATTGNFDFDINETPPHEFPASGGTVGKITATYVNADNQPFPIVWDATALNLNYRGGRLDLSLAFASEVLDLATLVITQPPVPPAKPAPDLTSRVGIVVVGPPIEDPPVGYFVYVPMRAPESTARMVRTVNVAWSKKGGISGPIGGGTVP